jgi:hypothetical protein
MKIIFCTFADSRIKKSSYRILSQAKKSGFYTDFISWDETDLPNDFITQNLDILNRDVRGFGYWTWKSELIKFLLNQIDEGDIIHYADVGCWINKKGAERFSEYLSMVNKTDTGVLAFQVHHDESFPELSWFTLPEYQWTKGDLLDYFGVRHDRLITNSEQIVATSFFVKKNNLSVELIDRWSSVLKSGRFLIDDTPSISPNIDGFIEHRHDQSVFSLLAKLYKVPTVSYFECFFPIIKNSTLKSVTNCAPDWKVIRNYPIHAKRDKDYGLLDRVRKVFLNVKKRLVVLI